MRGSRDPSIARTRIPIARILSHIGKSQVAANAVKPTGRCRDGYVGFAALDPAYPFQRSWLIGLIGLDGSMGERVAPQMSQRRCGRAP
jgi:hypothetical protein